MSMVVRVAASASSGKVTWRCSMTLSSPDVACSLTLWLILQYDLLGHLASHYGPVVTWRCTMTLLYLWCCTMTLSSPNVACSMTLSSPHVDHVVKSHMTLSSPHVASPLHNKRCSLLWTQTQQATALAAL